MVKHYPEVSGPQLQVHKWFTERKRLETLDFDELKSCVKPSTTTASAYRYIIDRVKQTVVAKFVNILNQFKTFLILLPFDVRSFEKH